LPRMSRSMSSTPRPTACTAARARSVQPAGSSSLRPPTRLNM
jgi:hypothetical protein